MTTSEQDLEQDFLQTALRRSEFLQRNEPKKANREYDRLDKIQQKMRQLSDRGEAAFKRIAAATTDLDVQIIAATALLPVDEPYGIHLLEQISSKRDAGIPSFTAEMTLREWRNGGMQKYRT
jgi:hypothetical protein